MFNTIAEFLDDRKNKKAEATRDRLQEIKDGVNTYATEENVARLEETALILHKYTTNPELIKNFHDNETISGLRISFSEAMTKLFAAQKEAALLHWDYLQRGACTDTVLMKEIADLNNEVSKKFINYQVRIMTAQTAGKKQENPTNPTTPDSGKSAK